MRGSMIIHKAALLFVSVMLIGCTSTEAEKDAKFSTPRIPLSDGSLFTQRATPDSACRQKWKEIKRVQKIVTQNGFVTRGKGEALVFSYQVNLMEDFTRTCKGFIMRNGR